MKDLPEFVKIEAKGTVVSEEETKHIDLELKIPIDTLLVMKWVSELSGATVLMNKKKKE